MYGIIYKATNIINDKIYIGQTKHTLTYRINGHYNHLFDDTYFHKALKKYKKEDWDWTIIDTAKDSEELNLKECFWIKFYQSNDPKIGYNSTAGGEGAKSMNKESYDKGRETRKSRHYTSESLQQKQSQNMPTKHRRHMAVKCIDTNQVFIDSIQAAQTIFPNLKQAELKNVANAIRKCARGDTKSARGYHWIYLSEEESRKFSPDSVILIETGEIFRSIAQAGALMHQSTKNIRECCSGKREDNAGYHWAWLNK